jgi:hypothetical protein
MDNARTCLVGKLPSKSPGSPSGKTRERGRALPLCGILCTYKYACTFLLDGVIEPASPASPPLEMRRVWLGWGSQTVKISPFRLKGEYPPIACLLFLLRATGQVCERTSRAGNISAWSGLANLASLVWKVLVVGWSRTSEKTPF